MPASTAGFGSKTVQSSLKKAHLDSVIERNSLMALNAIGLVELSSIALGHEVEDTMLKTASVELLVARTICSGKYSLASYELYYSQWGATWER